MRIFVRDFEKKPKQLARARLGASPGSDCGAAPGIALPCVRRAPARGGTPLPLGACPVWESPGSQSGKSAGIGGVPAWLLRGSVPSGADGADQVGRGVGPGAQPTKALGAESSNPGTRRTSPRRWGRRQTRAGF